MILVFVTRVRGGLQRQSIYSAQRIAARISDLVMRHPGILPLSFTPSSANTQVAIRNKTFFSSNNPIRKRLLCPTPETVVAVSIFPTHQLQAHQLG